ncbi:hypothetical protein K493DRAFT_265193 [Basidiobolus meristosporus CBS 931.73]|uniref:chitin synthase n=1 Tax=Basidiobolus meristosporus CBS 931.73 TaxID=1314790 RepID=A0A1Y1XYR7_9FUNG|nr:hypothetical protein K493DRAFT_265193 [Basidiobolus meristosporus CBS 931.73]|eukprot:ORX90890.1 hypothetical protein K493DRAFT_265193 [Basidiobolus meristosporus CBS 931.73]
MSSGNMGGAGCDDLSQLTNITDDTVLRVLQQRFEYQEYYTKINSSALVFVNPFGQSDVNNEALVHQYAETCYRDTSGNPPSLPPHTFELASQAYLHLRRSGIDQAIILSGLSGSGKTEAYRSIIRQLCHLASHGKEVKVHNQIQQAHTILEAFGNAKTLLNNNASRYGMFQEVQYNARGKLIGAKTLSYLLEKSRVTNAPAQERNFNAFYYLLAGASADERSALGIHDLVQYPYLAHTAYDISATPGDAAKFQELRSAMKALGLKTKIQVQIFRLLATILQIGTLQFADDFGKEDTCYVKNEDVLEQVAEGLGVSPSTLSDALIYKSKYIGKDVCTVFLNANAASEQRDSLARALYSLLFTWVVEAINTRICHDEPSNFIGVLDQFGFQTAAENGFEQFCINFANEKVHSMMLHRIFDYGVGINAELREERVALPELAYMDNSGCMELLCGKDRPGMIDYLDEVCSEDTDEDSSKLVLKINDSFNRHSSYRTSQSGPEFGINHFAGTVQYSLDQFTEKNRDILDADFVALFRGSQPSTNAFVTELFSSAAISTESHPRSKQTIVSAQQPTKPMRQPSRRYKKRPSPDSKEAKSHKTSSVLKQLNATLTDIFDTIDETHTWFMILLKSNEQQANGRFDPKAVSGQLRTYLVDSIATRLGTDFTASFLYEEFLERYNVIFEQLDLDNTRGTREKIEAVKMISGWKDYDLTIGSVGRVFLSEHVWKELEDSLRSMEKEDRAAQKFRNAEGGIRDDESLASDSRGVNLRSAPYLNPPKYGSDPASGYFEDDVSCYSEEDYSRHKADQTRGGYGHYGEDEASNYGSERGTKMEVASQFAGDIELQKAQEMQSVPAPVEEDRPVTRGRRVWMCMTWGLTWWIPTFMISMCGMKRPDVQIAWREKLALCILIVLMWGVLMFFIIGLGLILCPRVYYYTPHDVGYHTGAGDIFVTLKGKVYDVSNFITNHAVSNSNPQGRSQAALEEIYFNADNGNNVDSSFQIPIEVSCAGFTFASGFALKYNYSEYPSYQYTAEHIIGKKNLSPGDLIDPYWFYNTALPTIKRLQKGDVAYNISTITQNSGRGWKVINGRVYNLDTYIAAIGQNAQYEFMDKSVKAIFSAVDRPVDITETWNKYWANRADYAQTMNCLNNQFYAGLVDTRKGVKCQFAYWIPVAFAILLCAVIVIKFLAALQLTSKRRPEDLDKFVICQVPCYTEGEDSLRKTIDSLAGLQYDDKRKLIFLIADGMIIGSGNDRPTPRIVCDILGVDPDYDPEPFSFQSIGEGNQQHNMAKVYSGLYEFEGHVVPYIVVAKVGKPSERSRPGNRGKRDSQIILMNFLNRVHFDSEMSPLDLEIYHQIKNVIGVNPAFYEYILMVDADTEVKADSLTRLIACMTHDARIIGLCGETQLANEEFSWATMIQVYEYYISHHLAKAFESLFGSVTCLPGCFCMYRIRTIKGSPLIINNEVINDYSENNVDTLHKKNLLSLGEDRYLTTLMLKHFPQYKMKFTPDALCYTVAPEKWSVLLSQRRRWINSTVHNLFELFFLSDLCGFCCFSMRFVVFLDLFGTITMPATVVYLIYLIVSAIIDPSSLSTVALIMFGVVYGLQAIIFILKRQWQHVGWMIIYLLAMPLFSFAIPIYAFWHFDDFSWGNTRVIVGDKGEKKMVSNEEPFNPKAIPMKKWSQFEQEAWEAGSSASRDHTSRSRSRSRFEGSQYEGSPYRSPSPFTGSQYGGSQMGAGNYYDKQSSYYQSQGYPEQRPASHLSPAAMLSPGFNGSTRSSYGPNVDSRSSLAYSQYGHDMSPDRHSAALQSHYDYPGQQMPMAMPSPQPSSDAGYYPTDQEILSEIRHILSTADLMTVTKKQVREQLALVFGVDMNPRRDFINNSIELVLQGQL